MFGFLPPVCLIIHQYLVLPSVLCVSPTLHSFLLFTSSPFCHLFSYFPGSNGGLIIQPSPLPAGVSYFAGVAVTWQAIQAGRDHGVGCTGAAGRRIYLVQVRRCSWQGFCLFYFIFCIGVKMVQSKSVLARSLLLLAFVHSVPLPSLGTKCTRDVARQCQGAGPALRCHMRGTWIEADSSVCHQVSPRRGTTPFV